MAVLIGNCNYQMANGLRNAMILAQTSLQDLWSNAVSQLLDKLKPCQPLAHALCTKLS